MVGAQGWLIEPLKPLKQRFGDEFFAGVPNAPGVYLMFDGDDRVIYVGQSGNLRNRLNTYKNAHPDRDSRKTIRLVHAVRKIQWEICENATRAQLREDELLQEHHPRFNRLNVWPKAYGYIGLGVSDGRINLWLTHDRHEESGWLYGAFKGGRIHAFRALIRLLGWTLLRCDGWWNLPRTFTARERYRHHSINLGELAPRIDAAKLVTSLEDFLSGRSTEILNWFLEQLIGFGPQSRFDTNWWIDDLLILETFFGAGPRRISELRRRQPGVGRLILPENLNALIIQERRILS